MQKRYPAEVFDLSCYRTLEKYLFQQSLDKLDPRLHQSFLERCCLLSQHYRISVLWWGVRSWTGRTHIHQFGSRRRRNVRWDCRSQMKYKLFKLSFVRSLTSFHCKINEDHGLRPSCWESRCWLTQYRKELWSFVEGCFQHKCRQRRSNPYGYSYEELNHLTLALHFYLVHIDSYAYAKPN